MRTALKDALFGLVTGAAIGLVVHLGALVASAEGAPHDEASRRVSAALARLATDNVRFTLALLLAVMLACALVGATVALLTRFAAPRLRRSRAPIVIAGTVVSLALLTLRAFLRQPALLEPSLGGAHARLAPLLAPLAARFGPGAVDALLALAAIALVARGLVLHRPWDALRRALPYPLALALLWASAGLMRTIKAPRARLLVLAADSLRPDRFSTALTPNLMALEARGVTFDHALSPIARTTPSWVSILTGLYPHTHGVRHMFPRLEARPAWLPYLPARLHAQGLRTSVISDYAGDFFPLFAFGFDHARLPPPLTLPLVFQREVVSRSPLALALLNHRVGHTLFPVFRFLMTNADPERLADEVLDELRTGDGNQAVFAFFSTTHIPFAAPAPYYKKGDPTYGGTHRYAYDVQRLADVTASDNGLPARDVQQIRALYDGALAAVDHAMGRILGQLPDDTTVVLLSDHGENLFEPGTTTHHGKWFKGGDEANRVPLVIAGPGLQRGAHIDEPVSLVDVTPTVAELLALPPPSRPLDGRSLKGALTGGKLEPRDVLAETGVWLNGPASDDGVRYPPLPELLEADPRDGWQLVLKPRYEDVVVEAKHRMLRRGARKLLYVPTATGARYELYDVSKDPAQTHDLFATDAQAPELVHALRRFLAHDPERELDARDHLQRRTED